MYIFLLNIIIWTHKTSSTPPPFIEVSVPSRESWLPCTCVPMVSIVHLSMILIFDFGTVPTQCGNFVGSFY